jgi:hypothetical protein
MQRNEKSETDAKGRKGNQEVAVGEDGSGALNKFHGRPVGFRAFNWGQH